MPRMTAKTTPTDASLTAVTASMLRDRIVDSGITQAQIARQLNITPPSVASYLTGEHAIRTDTLERLADAMNCDVQILLIPRS